MYYGMLLFVICVSLANLDPEDERLLEEDVSQPSDSKRFIILIAYLCTVNNRSVDKLRKFKKVLRNDLCVELQVQFLSVLCNLWAQN